jgi:hypothetical protein
VGDGDPPPGFGIGRVSAVGNAAAAVRKQLSGTNSIDEWGMDLDAVAASQQLARLRWSASVTGTDHLPDRGPALLVAGRPPLRATALLVATAIGRESGRAVRFTGIADIAPVGPLLRRAGGVIARPDEVRGLLRAGQLVVVWCPAGLVGRRRVGQVPCVYLDAALAVDAPVLPVAVMAPPPLARSARLGIGAPVVVSTGRGPIVTAELAEAVRSAIQQMLDEARPQRRWPRR